MKYDVMCVGIALMDNIIRGFNPESVSASGYLAKSASLNVGGEAVNTSIAAAKLGLRTGILCALGEDLAGEMVLKVLQKYGVDTRSVVRTDHTPITTMFVREDGSRRSIATLAHRSNFHPEKDPSLFTDAKALILGSLFRTPFNDPDIIHSALNSAKSASQLVIADTKIPNDRVLTLEDIADSLPLIDYITPNEDEARYFTGQEEPEAMADVFLGFGVKHVIIKLGGKGCLLKSEKETLRLPAFHVNAVDSTGAGDNFAAGFASEILRGASVEEALRFANACGAICATAIGAGTALVDRKQVTDFLSEHAMAEGA